MHTYLGSISDVATGARPRAQRTQPVNSPQWRRSSSLPLLPSAGTTDVAELLSYPDGVCIPLFKLDGAIFASPPAAALRRGLFF